MSDEPRKGLGRGLSALLGDETGIQTGTGHRSLNEHNTDRANIAWQISATPAFRR